MSVRQIYILRHGNTFDKGDIVTRVGARTDLPLSHSGQIQAAKLSEHFKSIEFSQIYSSPLLRTLQTAQAVAGLQEKPLAIQKTDFLKEIDYGPDENKPEADVVARVGADAIARWDSECISPKGWIVDADAITHSWRDFFFDLAKSKTQGPVLVVTSNGIARFILKAVTQALPDGLTHKLATGAYGLVTLDARGQSAVADWNLRP
jgi:probable phosphoglycerate mutase